MPIKVVIQSPSDCMHKQIVGLSFDNQPAFREEDLPAHTSSVGVQRYQFVIGHVKGSPIFQVAKPRLKSCTPFVLRAALEKPSEVDIFEGAVDS